MNPFQRNGVRQRTRVFSNGKYSWAGCGYAISSSELIYNPIIIIEGYPESTSTELFQNGFSQGTTTSADDGKFVFDGDLSQGNNTFYAQATSSKGQKSEKSDTYVISYSNKSPKLDLNNVRDGDTVKESSFKITGATDMGNAVTINDRLAMTGLDGVFSLSLSLSNGENKLKIVAMDAAGNQTTKEITIKYSP